MRRHDLFPNLGHSLYPNYLETLFSLSDALVMQNDRSTNFKEYLQEELILRCKKNPAYSLRSFAKSLDISPSFLSKVLNGQRRITDSVFAKLANNLSLDLSTIEKFKSTDVAQTSQEIELQHIQLEYFKIISDWYHYAIIELTLVSDFQNSAEWISARLGITTNQTKAAIDRLLALDLLILENGHLKPTSGGNTTTKNEFTALAFKKMQNDLLELATKSLWNDPIEMRDHTSICMAMNTADIPEIKKKLTKMRREICSHLERKERGPADQVYNLSLSFFPLTKESK